MRWDGGGRETQRIGCQAREIRKPLGKLMKLGRGERERRKREAKTAEYGTERDGGRAGKETLLGSRLNKRLLPRQHRARAALCLCTHVREYSPLSFCELLFNFEFSALAALAPYSNRGIGRVVTCK